VSYRDHDWKTRGRPHSVYVVGGIVLVALHAARPFIVDTGAWHAVTDALIDLSR
jgi:hypothetical protein